MFTGIITDIGEILAISQDKDPIYTVKTNWQAQDYALGASIAHSGVCLTVIDRKPGQFDVQVSAETLAKTTVALWRVGTRINLERSMKLGDELGGHLVYGHVDGLAVIEDRQVDGDSVRFSIRVPDAFAKYIAAKGSVALDGVSLTVNSVSGSVFGINIIPHTQKWTTFGTHAVGDKLNLEVDMMARYVARMLGHDQ